MQNLYKTAAVVTVFSAFEHCLGFLYRIILSRVLGPEGLGIYQVALSVFAVLITVSSSGLPITLSRTISKHRAKGSVNGERAATSAAALLSLLFTVPVTILLFLLRTPFSKIFSDPRCADLFYIMLVSLAFTSIYAIIRGSFWGNKRFFAYSLIELIEEIIMIASGIFLLLCTSSAVKDINKAAIAVLISYLCSFAIALVYFLIKGGKFHSPKGEILPLLKSSLPVTAMRTSSSLMNSFISVLFPMQLMAAGYSSSKALSEYGVVYGMVMPVLMIPSTLVSSIALVLVPELSENFYKNNREKVNGLVNKALCSTLLIAGVLIPFFAVCGEGVGVFLYSSAKSGELITWCAPILLPMSVTMISTSLLNSMNCEKQTLVFYLLGSSAMLACVFFLPKYLGSGALCLGMALEYTVTGICSLILLLKKAGSLKTAARYAFRLLFSVVPVTVGGILLLKALMACMNYLPATIIAGLVVGVGEVVTLSLLHLFDFRAFLARFFKKKAKKVPSHS